MLKAALKEGTFFYTNSATKCPGEHYYALRVVHILFTPIRHNLGFRINCVSRTTVDAVVAYFAKFRYP